MKKIIFNTLCFVFCALCFALPMKADEFANVEAYEVEGSLFQRIADLEQEKVLMQLEKEKAQLQLDLDRLAAEKARLFREQESADVRAEEQAAEIERQKLAIDKERQKLEEQKSRMAEEAARRATDEKDPVPVQVAVDTESSSGGDSITDKYILREIVGAGNQLFATVESRDTGKQRRLSVGRDLDGYNVRSISLDDGVEFEKDGQITVLGIKGFGTEN